MERILLIDGNRGIYVPKQFAEIANEKNTTNISAEQLSILKAGPYHGEYWEVWDEVTRDADYIMDDGTICTLYQDGDLWAIPPGYVWPEE